MKYYIMISNPETEPRYVKAGKGFSGVEFTDSLKAARLYDTYEAAEKVMKIAEKQKNKERGGETSAIEIVVYPDDAGDVPEPPALPEPPAPPEEKQDNTGSGNEEIWVVRGFIGGLKLELRRQADKSFLYRYKDPKNNIIESGNYKQVITAFCKDAAKEMITKADEYERKRCSM